MSNIKFNTNRKNISDEQALKHKSFDKVMAGYNAMSTPLYKTFKFWAGAGIAVSTVVVATLLITGNLTGTSKQEAGAVKPPVAELDIPSTSYFVDAGKDTIIITESGSQLKIAANSFTDEKGNQLSGKVEIKYREFHDVIDIFMSGIPMDYDSAGTTYHFESAGMFEIQGFQDGREAFIKAESPVNVLLASKQEGERFNIYRLDDKSGDWSYEGRDTAGGEISSEDPLAGLTDSIPQPTYPEEAPKTKAIQKLETEVREAKSKTEDVVKTKPVEPQKAAAERRNLKIEVNDKDFPELALYKNLLFELDKNDKTYKPELAKITWDAASVKKGKEAGTYLLTFTKGADDYIFVTRPVVSEKDYPKAVELYSKKFEEYEKTLAKRKEDEARKQKELEAEYARLNAEREAQMADLRKRAAEQTARILASGETRDIIYRSFMVSNFGIWNSDCPQSMPKGMMVSATFSDKSGKSVAMLSLFLVEKGKNAVYSYYSWDRFQFNPKAENIILGITADNKIAIFKAEDFAALGPITANCNFKMDVVDKKFTNIDEVKAFVGI